MRIRSWTGTNHLILFEGLLLFPIISFMNHRSCCFTKYDDGLITIIDQFQHSQLIQLYLYCSFRSIYMDLIHVTSTPQYLCRFAYNKKLRNISTMPKSTINNPSWMDINWFYIFSNVKCGNKRTLFIPPYVPI